MILENVIPTRPWERYTLVALLGVTAALLVYLAWRTGITVDEPAHLVSARLYWERGDRLRPGDMPPLVKIVGGWVPALFELPLPANLGDAGENRHEWEVSLAMMEKLPWARIQPLFFYARLPMLVFPLLTIALLWRWARQLFAPATALIAAALFAWEPTALAHGAIIKNDHAATFAYLALWYGLWRYWRSGSLRAAGLVGIGAALCAVSKLTLLFAMGLAPALIVAGDLIARRLRWRTAASAALVCAIAYASVLCAVQFEAHTLAASELSALDRNPAIPPLFAATARVFTLIPVPDRMWAGLVTLLSGSSANMPVYLLGEIRPRGHVFYFLVCLLVKTPVTLLALGATGIGVLFVAAARGRLKWTDMLWIAPLPLYIALASSVPYQLGIRLILPALPFGILVACRAMEWLNRWRAGRAAAALALALFAFEAASIYPFGLSFFNVAAGGPQAGFRYLADSNLDWGQGLGELSRWGRKQGALPIALSYFGTDMMFRHFKGDEVKPFAPPWTDALAKGVTEFVPRPGEYYAISPTLLPGQFFAPKYRDFYVAFRRMTPVARPGYSIFVYRVRRTVGWLGKNP